MLSVLQLWDVIIESPIHILSCRCTTNALPAYSPSGTLPGINSSSSATGATECSHNHSGSSSRLGVSMHMSVGSSRHAHAASGTISPNGHHAAPVTTLAQSMLFARLVAGEETPAGEVPPTYDAALAAPVSSTSRGRGGRSGSRGGGGSRSSGSGSGGGSRRRRSDVSAGTIVELRQRLVEEPEEEEERGFDADEEGERDRGRATSRDVSRGR